MCARTLSRRAGRRPGQRGYVAAGIETMLRTAHARERDLPAVAGEALRQLATLGTASLQAVIVPIIKRGNIDGWQMRAPAWSCRRTLPPPARAGPGRAAAAAWFWPRSVPGRGPGLGVPEGLAHEPAWLCDPGSSRIGADFADQAGPWLARRRRRGGPAGRARAEPLTDGRGRVLVVLGCGAAGSGMAPFPSASGERCRVPATAAIAADRDAQAEGTARR
jgi:hypothetical protein